MTEHTLVSFNAVRPLGDFSVGQKEMQSFLRQLPGIFAAGRDYDGLIWHTHGARAANGDFLDNLTSIATTDTSQGNPHVLTMAGWTSLKAMHGFVYRRGKHVEGMKSLRHWVDRSEGPTMVLWWSPRGQRVTLQDGWDKLCRLRAEGPGADAFTLSERFDPPHATAAA